MDCTPQCGPVCAVLLTGPNSKYGLLSRVGRMQEPVLVLAPALVPITSVATVRLAAFHPSNAPARAFNNIQCRIEAVCNHDCVLRCFGQTDAREYGDWPIGQIHRHH